MTVRTNWYTMDNKLGVNLYNTLITSINSSATPNPDYPGPPANLGDRVQGNAGSEWMFVQASATVTANNLIAIDVNGKCANLTTALITSGVYSYGIATIQATQANATDQFWACLKANNGAALNAVTTGSAATGAALYLSAEPGRVTTSVLAPGRLNGPQFATTATGNAQEVVMIGYILPQLQIYASTTA